MARAGDGVLHPVFLGALAALVLNDHVLKAAFASWWTGKLSDAAIMVVLPLFLVAVEERVRALFGRFVAPSRGSLLVAIGVTTGLLVLINTTRFGAEAYRHGLGALQWPFRALLAVVTGSTVPTVRPVFLASDPTDLITLPFAIVAWVVGLKRIPPAP